MAATLHNYDFFKVIETWAPKHLAFDWDNVGLQIGSSQKSVHKVMVTLDVLESTADEAIEQNVDLIIAHHPILFKPLKSVNTDTAKGRTIEKLLSHNITVYAAHTNLDMADNGINDMLCDQIGIEDRDILAVTHKETLLKLAVFVPETHADVVRDAMSEQGAGYIGNYSHCTFQTSGYGTFKPAEDTNPYIGTAGEFTEVNEVKIETILPESKLSSILKAMRHVHPYEEPAYDIYSVENNGKSYGIGRIGKLSDKMTLKTFCEKIKRDLNVSNVRVTGDLNKTIQKAAILGGSGEKYLHQAKRMGADVYITGDMTFHPAQDAWEKGLPVIDAGHYIEKVMKDYTRSYLNKCFAGYDVSIIISEANTEPFQII